MTSLTCTVEEPTRGASSGSSFDIDRTRHLTRRRHSSYHATSWRTADYDDVQALVDQFLTDLGRRLEMMETYGHLKLDEGKKSAYSTLYAVHDRCKTIGDDIIDAGLRRAKVMVDTLESQYHGALARKDTLEQKVAEGVRIMEAVCEDLEKRAYDMRKAGLAATASDMFDSGVAYAENASSKAAEIVSEGAEKAKWLQGRIQEALHLARSQGGVIHYKHLPEPWRINPYILSGYRFCDSNAECVRSCFTTLSNETVNIWSHFIGLLIVLFLAFYLYPTSTIFSQATNVDILIAGVFFFAACKCLVCSTMWHTMNSISNQTLMERFACVDYTGISLLVAASIMTTEYTAFYCEPWPRWIYMTTTLCLGIMGCILPWHPTFNRADMAWARVGFFVFLGATGFVPVLQLTIERGWSATLYFYAPIAKSIAVYLTGAVLYASKVPEVWRPGLFDYVGGSHNIWHCAVLGGILFHYTAMQEFFKAAFLRAEGDCSLY